MSGWELSKIQLIAAILLGVAISIIISMLFGYILTYTPSVEVIPKIEATPIIIKPTVVPILNATVNDTFVVVLTGVADIYTSPIFALLVFIFVASVFSSTNRSFTTMILIVMSILAWWIFPNYFIIFLMFPAIYFIYILFFGYMID